MSWNKSSPWVRWMCFWHPAGSMWTFCPPSWAREVGDHVPWMLEESRVAAERDGMVWLLALHGGNDVERTPYLMVKSPSNAGTCHYMNDALPTFSRVDISNSATAQRERAGCDCNNPIDRLAIQVHAKNMGKIEFGVFLDHTNKLI